MSWEEVKKINSNLDVPLNERVDSVGNTIKQKVEYVQGIIPRGTVLTEIQKNSPPVGSALTMVDIKGSGYMIDLIARGANTALSTRLEAWLDAGTSNEQHFTFVSNYVDSKETGILVNMDSKFSKNLLYNMTDNLIEINQPLRFEHSLKVICKANGSSTGSALYGRVSYCLC